MSEGLAGETIAKLPSYSYRSTLFIIFIMVPKCNISYKVLCDYFLWFESLAFSQKMHASFSVFAPPGPDLSEGGEAGPQLAVKK